jgi:hypothetical protein
MVDILRSMIAEDEARKSRPAPESRSVDQLVADLIFDLRDATGSAYEWAYEPWLADLVSPPPSERPKGASPQDRLAALGLVAVPQLRAALGDQRPTRSCSYFERFGGSFTVDTVGYWARVILERIDNAARQPSPR